MAATSPILFYSLYHSCANDRTRTFHSHNVRTQIIIISDVGQEVAPLLSHLEEKPISQSDWYKRIKLSLDIARGLEHLHRHGIVHG